MAIGDDFSISYDNKIVSHSAGTTIYSVQQLYSYLQNTFDEQSQMDDTVPMSAQTPSEFTLINGWFIPDKSTQFLASGSIQTLGHSGSVIVCRGTEDVTFVHADLGLEISGSTSANVGTLLDFQTDNFGLFKVYIRPSSSADIFADPETLVVSGGTGEITMAVSGTTGETIFTNVYGLGSLVANTKLYVYQSGSIIGDSVEGATAPRWWGTQFFDVLMKVKEAGTTFNDSNLRVFAREYKSLYDHFDIRAPIGRNAVPLATSNDSFNATDSSSIWPYSTSIAITLYTSSQNYDLDNGNGLQPYNCVLDCGTQTLANVYEYTKYITDRLFFDDIDDGTNYDPVTGSIYIYASASFTPNKQAPFGSYTGKFFAARGVWLTNLHPDDVKNFSLIDSLGVIQDPPNTVAVTVTSVSGTDHIGVFRTVAGEINKAEYYTSASIGTGANYIIVSGAITTDTPKDSTIRLTSAGDIYRFTDWTNDGTPTSGTFFLSASITTTQDYTSGSASYVPIIDETAVTTSVSNTLVQSTAIPVLVRVRNGTPDYGILPFEIASSIGASGLSIAAIRTTDTINTTT
jgi:hypothetical protein